MKKKSLTNLIRASCVCLLVVAILIGVFAAPGSQVSGYNASFIQKLDNAPKLDLQDYLNNSVAFQLPDTVKDDDQISVIITVDVANLMDSYEAGDKTMSFKDYALHSQDAADIDRQIAAERAKILSKLDEQKISYTTGDTYNTLLSGFEVTITARDFNATCKSLTKGQGIMVSEVYEKCETKLVENEVNVYGTGIFNSAGCGYDGSGMVVAVLDTGLDSNHTAFSPKNFTSDKLGLSYKDVAALVGSTVANKMYGGLTADDVYINEKVPFGYDYADNDPDVYSTHNNHGTHVSGVIVGKDDTITGVAPNAQLVSMKIFSDVYDSAISSWILSALEDCVILGVDVINMSLGTACGFARESDEEIMNGVYDKLRNAGISVIVAASNSYSSAFGSEKNGNLPLTSNPDTGTVGSPGTYKGVMSVASINGEETPYLKYGQTIMYFDEANSAAAKELDFVKTLLGEESSKEIEFVVIPGVGRSADYTGMDVKGKIALVRRGSNTFEEKAMIAEAQGAAGIIIYNNVSGDIKMNVGDAKLAVCSISQADGEVLAATGGGKLSISVDQTSGPFISDFSSWGPTPSLNIKPEITAHGGNILSSVTGGGYDRLSGTSMACPNLAGVVILLRQYVVENFPNIANDNVKVNEMVNKLMMSTADIALNTNGLPYAVRKQGAGLANLTDCLNTKAYLSSYDKDGKLMDKPKLELGDDPNKTGVYEMKFVIHNFGTAALSYDIGGYVLTEGVSDTKTNAGETTVTEEAYALAGAIEVVGVSGGSVSGKNVTVNGGSDATVTVKVTLTEEDKKYLNDSFENGMYVEGFITLTATAGTDIDMGVPYLAFYGDWTKAPMMDLDYYATNADELDDGIDPEDKTMADAYATRPIGGISEDYVSFLGTYYFIQNPKDIVISANRDYIALSNQEGTIHSLRFVWAGLLRNAAKIVVTITDDTTGEVIYETVDYDVRKSYGDGGSIYPANVEIEFDTTKYNLNNNTEYTVRLQGYMDYGNGGLETNENNVFEFPLVIDFEAPTITDVQYYYQYDKTMKKNRLYAKVGIYDNHFSMASQLGYINMGQDDEGNETPAMQVFSNYMTPVYSQRNSTTYVTYELTDHVYTIKEQALNKNSFVLTVYDYALNMATFEIGLPDDYIDFYFDGLEEGLTLSPNEVFSLEPLVYPNTEWSELLEFSSSKSSVVRVVNNKLVATGSGVATVQVRDPATNKKLTFKVTVLQKGDDGYRRYDKPVADVFKVTGFTTVKAFYMVDSNEKKLGDTGDTRYFDGKYSLSMYPSESVALFYDLDAYFPNDTTVSFESSNSNIVEISSSGVVTAKKEGFSSVSVRVMMDGKSTYYSETITIEVKDPYVHNAGILNHYYGNGGLVTIPSNLSLKEIGSFAFSNFDYVAKTPEELAIDDQSTTKQWYIGENTITKVVIPEGVTKINAYAFAQLTALEEIVLPSTLESIEYGAFYGCSSLKKITYSGENNTFIINQNAFASCDLRGTIDLTGACVISDYAFAGNQNLEGIITDDSLLSIGQYAFAGCKKLKDVTITSEKVKYGAYAFNGCASLESFYVNASVLPEGMFYQCDKLTKVTIGPDVNDIGPFAFRSSNVETFELAKGNQAFKLFSDNIILSADGKTLVAVAPTIRGSFNTDNLGGEQVTTVGKGAFSHNVKIDTVNLPDVTVVGEYGFGSSTGLTSVKLGQLSRVEAYGFFETGITQLPAFTDDVTVGQYAFSHTKLTSVNIPDGMILSEGVFSECVDLQSVVIGNNVNIGDYAFSVDKDNCFSVKSYDQGGEKYFHYVFSTKLTNLTIGDNATIGKSAFSFATNLKKVTLGAGATIGDYAFYNNSSLTQIDLSKALSIGEYAFSGDEYNVCLDENMSVPAVDKEGFYITESHASSITDVNLSSATSIGQYAFALCTKLKNVVLGEGIVEIPTYAFASCDALENIDLSKVTTIGDYAFQETQKLKAVDLSSATSIGKYAFVNGAVLSAVKLNPNGSDIGEGAFCYNENLKTVENLEFAKSIDKYAFAYAGIINVDLNACEKLGDFAFMKEEMTDFTVKLGSALVSVGDNPFAMCRIAPFSIDVVVNFNGVDYTTKSYSYDISDTVKVIDGSLYCKINTGLELIVYAGTAHEDVKIADGTVRITGYAFAGSDVKMVTLPYTVASIGHKAFFDCQKLNCVVFTSYDAPILEEEFDKAYYDCFENIPGSGEYGTYNDYDGTEVTITGMGLIPYFMWNANSGQYYDVFYGANFIDYVGYVDNKLTMVRPVNGQHYETYIMGQYFDLVMDGAAGADDVTLAAIAAINAIPERVTYAHKDIVEAARAAYNKISTKLQQSLVTNYDVLVSAEQRISALAPKDEVEDTPDVEEIAKKGAAWLAWVVIVVGIAGVAVAVFFDRKGIKKNIAVKTAAPVEPEAPAADTVAETSEEPKA